MKTIHRLFFSDSSCMNQVPDSSVDLVVTSPPYPMIEMWDSTFAESYPEIASALENNKGTAACLRMHDQLNKTWTEVIRVLKEGGTVCINIGDATRKIGDRFSLYPNHSFIVNYFINSGLFMLPSITWRKQSNKPNKFMGSGMMPPNAYITLEHEYILIFRKGAPRNFTPEEKERRYRSSYFWEERNLWFNDIWEDVKGTGQKLTNNQSEEEIRDRSAAFPFEIPSRLIHMFSIQGDTVLDPFLGTGTTTLAAIASGRSSIGYEHDENFYPVIRPLILNSPGFCREYTEQRLNAHARFINQRREAGKVNRYTSEEYGFDVVTRQEIKVRLPVLEKISEQETGVFMGVYQ